MEIEMMTPYQIVLATLGRELFDKMEVIYVPPPKLPHSGWTTPEGSVVSSESIKKLEDIAESGIVVGLRAAAREVCMFCSEECEHVAHNVKFIADDWVHCYDYHGKDGDLICDAAGIHHIIRSIISTHGGE